MTHVITARNVNDAFVDGLWWLKVNGQHEESRNGQVIVSPVPVVTNYLRPTQRVLFDATRDCNPFFHLFEAVWMLAGCREVAPLLKFNKRMADFAEKGGYIHGAYGDRWFYHFGMNQIHAIVELLQRNPDDRQAVLQMWNCQEDLGKTVRDKPCNTHCYFRINRGRLDMTICCRSNDVIWGAYGANAVHFSILQEFVANTLEVPVGTMVQFSNNYHIYTSVPRFTEMMNNPALEIDPYKFKAKELDYIVAPGRDPWGFIKECYAVVRGDYSYPVNSWLRGLVIPMIRLWETRDRHVLLDMVNCDWKVAFIEWLDRRDHASK